VTDIVGFARLSFFEHTMGGDSDNAARDGGRGDRGKTGIDLEVGKNLIGAFWPPPRR